MNDHGDADGPFAGSFNLPGSGTVSNSQCTVEATGSSASSAGNALTLTLKFTFHAAFRGDRIVWAAARDTLETNSGWQPIATVSVP